MYRSFLLAGLMRNRANVSKAPCLSMIVYKSVTSAVINLVFILKCPWATNLSSFQVTAMPWMKVVERVISRKGDAIESLRNFDKTVVGLCTEARMDVHGIPGYNKGSCKASKISSSILCVFSVDHGHAPTLPIYVSMKDIDIVSCSKHFWETESWITLVQLGRYQAEVIDSSSILQRLLHKFF